jgi:hypothetical protein
VGGGGPVVVLIAADPRTSHRAFEALRIGVGILAGDNDVRFVLTGPAVHLLDADTDSLVEGDDVASFRATLRRLGVPVHVDAAAVPAGADWNADGPAVVAVGGDALVDLLRAGRHLLVF